MPKIRFGGRNWETERSAGSLCPFFQPDYVYRLTLGKVSGGLLNYTEETIILHDLKTLANPFQFADLDIRTATDENSEVWFCAKDVCSTLEIGWTGHTLDNMPHA
jgi:hypothetical protein